MEEVKSSIKKILPNISEDLLRRTLSLLEDLGVENIQHLQFVNEEDLSKVLKKIPARILVKEWNNKDGEKSSTSFEKVNDLDIKQELEEIEIELEYKKHAVEKQQFLCVPFDREKSSTSSEKVNDLDLKQELEEIELEYKNHAVEKQQEIFASVPDNFNPLKYNIPWDLMPLDLKQCLNENQRPHPSLRKKMVRIICDDIYKIIKKPGRKRLSVIAKKIVEKYPQSFSDEIGSQINGISHLSLLKQLEARFDNLNRSSIISVLKRKLRNQNQTAKKGKLSDDYGCVKYQPDLPFTETAESQKEKCEIMKMQASLNPASLNKEMKRLLKDTYFSIRWDINSGKDLNYLTTEWPLLFTKEGFLDHFNELVGVNITEKLGESTSKLGPSIVSYFLSDQNLKASFREKNIRRKLFEELKIDRGRKEDLYDLKTVITLLMTYFEDKMEQLFTIIVAVTNEEERSIPDTPCLICCGDSLDNLTSFMLAVDGMVVFPHLKSFEEGVAVLFSAFFNLNIEYPSSASTTLEFIQRCFLDINPLRGSKRDSPKTCGVDPKIVSLKKRITDYEWNLL